MPAAYTIHLCLRRLRKTDYGATAVEFALVVPLVMLLMGGIVEFAHLYYVRLTVRDVALEATRYAVTGRSMTDPVTGQPISRAASIRRLVTERSQARAAYVDSVTIDPANGGVPGQVVKLRIFYRYNFAITPLRAIAPRGVVAYSVGTSMKNEPAF